MKIKLLLTLILMILAGQMLHAAAPGITSFSPATGRIGTLITINGTNLGSPTAFTIGGATAVVVTNTGTQIAALVMPGAVTGPVSLTTAGGTAKSTGNFTVLAPPTTQMVPQQDEYLVANGLINPSNPGEYLQGPVALSANGNTAVVGTSNSSDGVSGETFIWERSGTGWVQQGNQGAQGTELIGTGGGGVISQGAAVAISADGNTVIIGGPGTDVTNNSYDQTGAVWIFTRTGTTWAQQGSLLYGSGAVGASYQGYSVALSADGNTALVGGYGDNNYTGATWVFTRSNGVWTQQGSKLVGTGATGSAFQGNAVAISADGNTALVGGSYDNNYVGAVWVYTRSNGVWTQQGSKLVGSGAIGQALEGSAVSISADGNTALIGGDSDNDSQGAAWVFTRSRNTWTQQGSKLFGTGATYYAYQGYSVALSADGNTALIGGPKDNQNVGALWEFTRSGSAWSQLGAKINGYSTREITLGNNVAMSADATTAFASISSGNSGGESVYQTAAPAVLAPTATTQAATAITTNGATLNGTVDDNGASTTVAIQYGTSPTLSGATTATLTTGTSPIPAGTGTTSFTSVLTGLTPSTTYYFQITGVNSAGTTNGTILSFSTPSLQSQTITFAPLANVTYGSPDVTPGATSTNTTIPIIYTSSNTAVATIVSGNIHITGAGTTTITASQAGNSNYSAATPIPQTLTVKKAPLTITANNHFAIQGQALPTLTISYSGFVNGDTEAEFTTQPAVGTTATSSSAMNYYPITVSGGSSVDYTFTYVPGTLTMVTLAYLEAPVSTTYGAAPFYTFNTATNGITYSSSNTGVATVTSTGQLTITGAGATTITFGTASGQLSKTLTVNPAPLTITANNHFAIQGQALPALTVSYSGFVNGDTPAEFTTQPTVGTTATSASAMNYYPITVSGGSSVDYTFAYVPGILTMVTEAYLEAPISTTYGAAPFYTFNTATNGITYSSSNTAAATVASTGQLTITGAGTTTITFGTASGQLSKTLTVNPAPLTITANNQSKTAGTANPTLTVSYSGFVNGDTKGSLTTQPTVTTTATTSSPAGTYPITASGAADANYAISYVAGTLTVSGSGMALHILLIPDSTVTDLTLAPKVNPAVSPNGDGINDVLTITNIDKYPTNKLALINQNGAKIFETWGYDNVNHTFDGHSNINGKLQQPGTYFYMLQYSDNGVVKSTSGYIVLKY
jgi:gliding motility-associated-like protein